MKTNYLIKIIYILLALYYILNFNDLKPFDIVLFSILLTYIIIEIVMYFHLKELKIRKQKRDDKRQEDIELFYRKFKQIPSWYK